MSVFPVLLRKTKNGMKFLLAISKYRFQVLLEKNKKSDCTKYVLMFHRISDNSKELADEYTISMSAIMKIIDQIMKVGYSVTSVNDFVNTNNKKCVLLTFDDAYDGVYNLFYPYAKKNNIPFCVFQAIDYLDKPNYLTECQIDDMRSFTGFTLGAHTVSHRNMSELSFDEIKFEVEASKKILGSKFNSDIQYFAYPFGALVSLSKECIKLAKNEYRCAFSTIQTGMKRKYLRGSGKYLIPRLNVNEKNFLDIINLIVNY